MDYVCDHYVRYNRYVTYVIDICNKVSNLGWICNDFVQNGKKIEELFL